MFLFMSILLFFLLNVGVTGGAWEEASAGEGPPISIAIQNSCRLGNLYSGHTI